MKKSMKDFNKAAAMRIALKSAKRVLLIEREYLADSYGEGGPVDLNPDERGDLNRLDRAIAKIDAALAA
jgi:hypothetical protein